MAEIGLVASVVQIADSGIKLSITLYTFAETVLKADKSIREIASDVSLTSSVLEELGQNLKKDQKSRLCSENAMKTAESIVKECAAIFNEINGTLETTLQKLKPRAGSEKRNGKDGTHGGRKLAIAALERLKWPFLQPKMLLLKSNLDRLKSTLVLMLNVITYARKVSEDHATPSTLEDQRRLIEDLARSNQEYTKKFKELTKAVEAGQDRPELAKPFRATENLPSSGIFLGNMVLPRTESFAVADDTSPDITSRLISLNKQYLPPDVGEQSDQLAHYCLLINHLLQRIDAVQYKIKSDVRRRIRNDVVHMHQREADQLKDVHGHGHFTTIMDSAISWAEILHFRHPTEFGASQTLRQSTHPDWSERDWTNIFAPLEREDERIPPAYLPTSIPEVERRETPGQYEKQVKRMIELEGYMRPLADRSPLLARPGRPTLHLLESHKLESEQPAASATDKSKDRTRASEGDIELQDEARYLLPQKSHEIDLTSEINFSRREPPPPQEKPRKKMKPVDPQSRRKSHTARRPIMPQHAYDSDGDGDSPGRAMISAESEQPESGSAHDDSNNEALMPSNSEFERYKRASYSSDSGGPAGAELTAATSFTWARISSVAHPEPGSPAKDAESVETSAAGLGYAHLDYSASDDEDGSPQEAEPPVTRPQSPDIVDNLLAEWTTLPR